MLESFMQYVIGLFLTTQKAQEGVKTGFRGVFSKNTYQDEVKP